MQLVVPVARFFLEQRLKLADAGLAKVEDIHRRAARAQLYDSRFGKPRAKGGVAWAVTATACDTGRAVTKWAAETACYDDEYFGEGLKTGCAPAQWRGYECPFLTNSGCRRVGTQR